MTTTAIDYFADIDAIVQLALQEDIGAESAQHGDVTAQLIPESHTAEAVVITREPAIVCGRPWFNAVFRQLDPSISVEWLVEEGQQVAPNDPLVRLSGNTRVLLTGERTALNFLQTLMGTATTTSHYAALFAGTKTHILDTRKTLPGLRLAQKYAVSIGGGRNHRVGLYDAFLIKENHIAACGSILSAVKNARTLNPHLQVEVEVETLAELEEALQSKADIIMLDNFDAGMVEQAVALKTGDVLYEISGNIDLASAGKQPLAGIDRVSSGALTKHCRAVDLSMTIRS